MPDGESVALVLDEAVADADAELVADAVADALDDAQDVVDSVPVCEGVTDDV